MGKMLQYFLITGILVVDTKYPDSEKKYLSQLNIYINK